jgi:hypothetical protein
MKLVVLLIRNISLAKLRFGCLTEGAGTVIRTTSKTAIGAIWMIYRKEKILAVHKLMVATNVPW